MILRKPYAFLIKHFRLLHLLMLLCLIFLTVSANDVRLFFTDLQNTGTLSHAGATTYINGIIYVIAVIVILLASIAFYLLKKKKKPYEFYLALMAYMVIYMIGYLYMCFQLTKVSRTTVTLADVMLYKDIALLLVLPYIYFDFICLIRGIGFDVKRFNFSKDVQELKIVDQDSAEYEFMIGQNSYKIKRGIRRFIRETKYRILENKRGFAMFVLMVIFVIGFSVTRYNISHFKRAEQSTIVEVNGFSYAVNSAYLTSYDYRGELVSDDYKYVVLDMTFQNMFDEVRALDLTDISLQNGRKLYYPVMTKNSRFYDLGVPYLEGGLLPGGEFVNATLTFEIPKKDVKKDFVLKIRESLSDDIYQLLVSYKYFSVDVKNIDSSPKKKNVNMKEEFETNLFNKNKFKMKVYDFEIATLYDSRYAVCTDEGTCAMKSTVLEPVNKNEDVMIELEFIGTMFEEANFTKRFKTYTQIFSNLAEINYKIGNKVYTKPAHIVSGGEFQDKILINTSREVLNSSDIWLIFNFRNNQYEIKLSK